MKTHWKKLTNPTYLGAYDFAEGEKRVLTIDKVLQDKVKGQDGKDEDCTICHFVGSKPMILNVTNCKAIAKAYGTNYIEECDYIRHNGQRVRSNSRSITHRTNTTEGKVTDERRTIRTRIESCQRR